MTSFRVQCAFTTMTVALLACSGAPARSSVPQPAPSRAPVVATPVSRVVPSTKSPPTVPVDEWFREVVDPEVQPRPISLSVRDGLVTVAVNPWRGSERATAFVSDGKRWDARVLDKHERMVAITWDPNGVPSLLLDAERGVAVKRGLDGVPEVLTFGRTAFFAHDIATAPDGVPHVCFSLEKEESAKEFVYAARTNLKKSGASDWHQERIPMAIGDCRVVATEDGVRIIVESDRGVSALSKIDGGSWKIEKLSSDWFASVAAARSPAGHAILAFSDNRTVHLVRYANGQTQRSEIALGLTTGDVRGLAMAIDRNNVVHVAFSLSHVGSVDGEVMYATERAPAAVLVSRDRPERIALALDEVNRPHLAYVPAWPVERDNQLIHVRTRTPAERTAPSGTYHEDEATILESCATLVEGEIGEMHVPFEYERAARWCGYRPVSLPMKEHLISRCAAGDVNACLIEATRAGQLKVISNIEIARTVCPSSDKKGRCWDSFKTKGSLAAWLGNGADNADAMNLFEKACALGSKAACMMFAFNGSSSQESMIDLLAGACSHELPIACSALLIEIKTKAESAKPVLFRVRNALTKACTSSEKPEACNALAYMEEVGLGGVVRPGDAVRHHLRACERGSVLSCVRLLSGHFGRPRPPQNLVDSERFEDLLSVRCSEVHDEDACLALATAYDTGWGVERDRDKAQAILDEACEAGHAGACKRAKKRNR